MHVSILYIIFKHRSERKTHVLYELEYELDRLRAYSITESEFGFTLNLVSDSVKKLKCKMES